MSEDGNNGGSGLKIHLSTDDYRIIVSWMEIPANFNTIYRKKTASQRAYDEKQVTKVSAYSEMAKHLHRHTRNKNFPLLNSHNMAQRWATYMKKFKAALEKSTSADGVELTRRECKKGMSAQEKLEQLCPHFSRLKQLFADDAQTLLGVVPRRSHSTFYDVSANGDESEVTRSGMQHEARGADSPSPVAESEREGPAVEPRIVFPAKTKAISTQKRKLGQLERGDRRWQEEQAERERQRAHELEVRNLDMAEKRAARRQELLLTLLAQGKSTSEIETFFKLVEDTAPTTATSFAARDQQNASDGEM